ncbi:MAG: spore germination protein [Bacillota bacterium]|nr:spore germination protein [Bacillota bacterium]
MNKKYNIGNFGLFTTIIVTVIGIGIFSYPRSVINIVENDAVLVTALAGIINIGLILYINGAIKINDYKDLSDIIDDNFGKVVRKIILCIFIAYFVILISLGVRTFAAVTKMYLLEKTPIEFIIVVLILLGGYHLRKGLENVISFNEFIFWFMFIPAALLLILPIKEADFTNLLPLFKAKPVSYMQAVLTSVFSFAGFEIVYFILPHMDKRNKIKKVSINSLIFVTVFYSAVLILVLAVFTKQDLKALMYSYITLARIIDIPGTFVERWYGVALTLWALFFYTTFINFYYFAADSLKSVLNFSDVRLCPLILSPIIYVVAIMPRNVLSVEKLMDNITIYFFAFTVIVFPSMLYMKKILKSKGRKK